MHPQKPWPRKMQSNASKNAKNAQFENLHFFLHFFSHFFSHLFCFFFLALFSHVFAFSSSFCNFWIFVLHFFAFSDCIFLNLFSSSWFARISSSAYQIDLRPPFLGIPGDWLPKSIQSSERKNPQMGSEQVCFSGSVLLESFDIEVVSYDGNLSRKSGRSHALKHTEDPDPGC